MSKRAHTETNHSENVQKTFLDPKQSKTSEIDSSRNIVLEINVSVTSFSQSITQDSSTSNIDCNNNDDSVFQLISCSTQSFVDNINIRFDSIENTLSALIKKLSLSHNIGE